MKADLRSSLMASVFVGSAFLNANLVAQSAQQNQDAFAEILFDPLGRWVELRSNGFGEKGGLAQFSARLDSFEEQVTALRQGLPGQSAPAIVAADMWDNLLEQVDRVRGATTIVPGSTSQFGLRLERLQDQLANLTIPPGMLPQLVDQLSSLQQQTSSIYRNLTSQSTGLPDSGGSLNSFWERLGQVSQGMALSAGANPLAGGQWEDLQRKIEQTRQSMAVQPGTGTGFGNQLANLQQQINAIQQTKGPGLATVSGLDDQLRSVQDQLRKLQPTAPAVSGFAWGTLQDQLNTLHQSLENQRLFMTPLGEQLNSIRDQIGSIRSNLSSQPQVAGVLSDQLRTFQSQMDTMRQSMEFRSFAAPQFTDQLRSIQDQMAAVRANLVDQRFVFDATGGISRIENLGSGTTWLPSSNGNIPGMRTATTAPLENFFGGSLKFWDIEATPLLDALQGGRLGMQGALLWASKDQMAGNFASAFGRTSGFDFGAEQAALTFGREASSLGRFSSSFDGFLTKVSVPFALGLDYTNFRDDFNNPLKATSDIFLGRSMQLLVGKMYGDMLMQGTKLESITSLADFRAQAIGPFVKVGTVTSLMELGLNVAHGQPFSLDSQHELLNLVLSRAAIPAPEYAVPLYIVENVLWAMPNIKKSAQTFENDVGHQWNNFASNVVQQFSDIQNRLGGVALNAVPQWDQPIGHLEGVLFDKVSGQVILVGDGRSLVTGVRADDLAVAFASEFGLKDNTIFVPQFSLDPADPQKPDGPWQKAVYIPEFLYGTHMGKVCYTTDWLMKQYSFGRQVDYLGTIGIRNRATFPGEGLEVWGNQTGRFFVLRKHDLEIPGFMSIPDLDRLQAGRQREEKNRSRLWLVVKDPVPIHCTGGAGLFGKITMGVETRAQEIGPDGRLRDITDPKKQNAESVKFAQLMTCKYDAIAEAEPAFAELRELAKSVAIARWVKKTGGDPETMDLKWIEPLLNHRSPGVLQVSRIGFEEHMSKRTATAIEMSYYAIHGGVDLDAKLDLIQDDQAAPMADAVHEALKLSPDAAFFPVTFAGKSHVGVVLPMGADAQKRWQEERVAIEDGVAYRVDRSGHVASSTDAAGNVSRYRWDSQGNLNSIDVARPDGLVTVMHAPDASGHCACDFRDADGNVSQVNWSPDFKHFEVRKNGRLQMETHEESAGAVAGFPGSVMVATCLPTGETQTIGRDNDGRPLFVLRSNKGADGRPLLKKTQFAWNADGSLHSLTPEDGAPLIYDYMGDGRVKSISDSSHHMTFAYQDDQGWPKSISISSSFGFEARILFEHGLGKRMEWSSGKEKVVADFDWGRPVRISGGSFEEIFEYYPSGGLRSFKNSRGEAIDWNREGGITSVFLSNGIHAAATYEAGPNGGMKLLPSNLPDRDRRHEKFFW